MQQWQCTVCGYIHTGSEPPENCPVCGADRSLFIPLSPQSSPETPAVPARGEAADIQPTITEQKDNRQWCCGVCGYMHTGASAPLTCPVCGVDQKQFSAVRPSGPPPAQKSEKAAPPSESPARQKNARPNTVTEPKSIGILEWILEKMVDLHAHPIAVHIPNGVLPISVIFLLLAFVFNSRTLSTAAFYNLVFVALAMPVVLFSGYNDWRRRFNGRLTNVFLIKMICGAVVFIGTFSGVIWRLADPEVLLADTPGNWGYLVLHVFVLTAAGIAGYFGGKLIIFPKKPR